MNYLENDLLFKSNHKGSNIPIILNQLQKRKHSVNNRVKSLLLHLQTLLHHQVPVHLQQIANLELIVYHLQKVQRANRAFDSRFQTCLDAGRMEKMETKERGNLVPLLDLIIADGALSCFTVVGGFHEMREEPFHVLAPLLEGQSHVHDSIMHKSASQRNVLVSQDSGDYVSLSVVAGKEKLCLDEIEDILAALDGARNPAFPDLYLVLAPFEVYFSGRLFDGDLVSASDDLKVDLGCLDLEGAVGESYYFLDDSSALKDDIRVLGVCFELHCHFPAFARLQSILFFYLTPLALKSPPFLMPNPLNSSLIFNFSIIQKNLDHHSNFMHLIRFIFIIAMNSKPTKPGAEEQPKNGDVENIKEYWTEHRTTLIAFQAQYVFNKKPDPREDDENDTKNRKGKKKDIEFQGGFLFPGREGDKEINVVEMIKQSGKYSNLKELFDESLNHSENTQQLREFVKIMLELKHPCIVKQFLEIYDNIIKQIKEVKFDQVKGEQDRFAVIDKIRDKVAGFVNSYNHTFKNFAGYMRDDKLETMKLFKVTAYCFLAEKFNFNINQFYSNAFQFPETEKKKTNKKNKTEKEDTANS